MAKTVKARPNRTADGNRTTTRKNLAVIPYLHRLSHGINNVANRYHVDVVFSVGHKLRQVCPAVHRKLNGGKSDKRLRCAVKHKKKFVDCHTNVVYKIPCSCGKIYIGQTSRCINIRIQEHAQNVKNGTGSHLALHCRKSGCNPSFDRTEILHKHRDQRTREIMEAFYMSLDVHICVSQPSVALSQAEVSYLRDNLPHVHD